MSSPVSPSLEISRNARLHNAVMAAVFAVLAGAPMVLQLALIQRLLSAGIVLAVGVLLFRRIGWLGGARSVHVAVWKSDGQWLLSNPDGSWEAELSSRSQRLGPLLRLRFDGVRGPAELLIWTPALAPGPRRGLQVRLQLHGHLQTDPRQPADDVR